MGTRPNVERRVKKAVRESLDLGQNAEIDLDGEFHRDFECDSLELVAITMLVEDDIGLVLPDDYEPTTPRELIACVEKVLEGKGGGQMRADRDVEPGEPKPLTYEELTRYRRSAPFDRSGIATKVVETIDGLKRRGTELGSLLDEAVTGAEQVGRSHAFEAELNRVREERYRYRKALRAILADAMRTESQSLSVYYRDCVSRVLALAERALGREK